MKKILVAMLFFTSFTFANKLKVVELDNLANKYVVYSSINCSACREEFKEIQKIYNKYKEMTNIAVVLYPSDENEVNYKFIKDNNYTFEVYYDQDHKIDKLLKIEYVPTIYKYEKGIFKKSVDEFLTEENFYKNEKKNIDKKLRKKLKEIIVKDIKGEKYNLLKLLEKNDYISYLSGEIKNKKAVILVDDKKYLTKDNYFIEKNKLDKGIIEIVSSYIKPY